LIAVGVKMLSMQHKMIDLFGYPYQFIWSATLLACAEDRDVHTDLFLVRIREHNSGEWYETEVNQPISLRTSSDVILSPSLEDILYTMSIEATHKKPIELLDWFNKIGIDPYALFGYLENLIENPGDVV